MDARHGRLPRRARADLPTRPAPHPGRHAGAVRERRADRVPGPASCRRARRVEDRRDRDGPPVLRRRCAVCRPRFGDQPVGRVGAGRRRHRHRPQPDEPHPARRPGGPHRRRRAGRDQPRHQCGGRAARAVLRPGSLEPVGLHHRRQRRLQFRRRALLPARDDRQPRAGAGSRAARRRGGTARRRQPRGRRARPDRPVRRIGGAVRRGRRNHRAAGAAARGLPHGARLLRIAAGRGRCRHPA